MSCKRLITMVSFGPLSRVDHGPGKPYVHHPSCKWERSGEINALTVKQAAILPLKFGTFRR